MGFSAFVKEDCRSIERQSAIFIRIRLMLITLGTNRERLEAAKKEIARLGEREG